MVTHVEKLGMRRYSGMFKNALETVCNIRPENITSKMACLKRALGRSEAVLAVCKLPSILLMSERRLSHKLEFLRMEFGLEPSYTAHGLAILAYDLEKRVMPRHYVIEVLEVKDLVKKDIDLYIVFAYTEKKFVGKYIDRYSERVLGLADAYAAACAGKIPEIQP
ncbi:transcription termination factor MTERF15, mitochondrial-like [Aegilops tauschii subsp. strangulata]|uniref:transcription termination factor MTERF15, mitochondrial-like n=1 Tax=Aegilops tauschii subsp. strangulata TaxID=200361 RepID=UPI003A5EAF71